MSRQLESEDAALTAEELVAELLHALQVTSKNLEWSHRNRDIHNFIKRKADDAIEKARVYQSSR